MAVKVSVTKTETQTFIDVDGAVDERAVLPQLSAIQGQIIINLAQLTFINSLGIRIWIKWIKSLKADKGIALVNCSPPFVRQMSILQNFIPEGVTVKDILVPYYCAQCSHEDQKLVNVERALQTVPNEIPCAKCNGKMELGILKNSYFKFWEKKAS